MSRKHTPADSHLRRRDLLLRGSSLLAASMLPAVTPVSAAQAQPASGQRAFTQSTRWDELSKLPFKESYPTPEASARLYDELLFQRAVQVYLWALPAMNMVAMRDGQAATFGDGNHVLAVFRTAPTPRPSAPAHRCRAGRAGPGQGRQVSAAAPGLHP